MTFKEKLIIKSEEQFFRYGIRSVGMDDLAREMGVSKKTLYQYVQNKEELIREIFARRCEKDMQHIAIMKEQAIDAVDEALSTARYMIKSFRTFTPTMQYDLFKYYREIHLQIEELHKVFFQDLVQDNILKGQEQGLYRENLNPKTISRLFIKMANSMGDIEHFPAKEFTMEELLRQLFRYHLHGVASPKGLKVMNQYLETNTDEKL